MSELRRRGVGVNGEPDDYAARYDRLVAGGGEVGWVVKTVGTLLVLLAGVGLLFGLLGG